jgi:hypothetical protein
MQALHKYIVAVVLALPVVACHADKPGSTATSFDTTTAMVTAQVTVHTKAIAGIRVAAEPISRLNEQPRLYSLPPVQFAALQVNE